MCNIQEKVKLATHLYRNPECMQGYFELFRLDSVIDISLQVTKLKKKSYSSRQPDKRAVEHKSKKVKEEDSCLNRFQLKTSFSSVFKCIVCKLHLSKSRTKRLKKEEWHLYAIDANDRRFGDYYICTVCEKNPRQKSNDPMDELKTHIALKNQFSIHTIMHSSNIEENHMNNIDLPRSSQASQDYQLFSQHTDFHEDIEGDNHLNQDLALSALIDNIPTQGSPAVQLIRQNEECGEKIDESDNHINPDLALDALIQNFPVSSQPCQDYPVMVEKGDCVEQFEDNNQTLHFDQPSENTPRSSQINQDYQNDNFKGSNQSTVAVNVSEDYHSRITVQK